MKSALWSFQRALFYESEVGWLRNYKSKFLKLLFGGQTLKRGYLQPIYMLAEPAGAHWMFAGLQVIARN